MYTASGLVTGNDYELTKVPNLHYFSHVLFFGENNLELNSCFNLSATSFSRRADSVRFPIRYARLSTLNPSCMRFVSRCLESKLESLFLLTSLSVFTTRFVS